MKWLLICDPSLQVEDYGELLSGVPSEEERAGCPDGSRAVYLEATLEQVRPLAAGDERVCRILPVWEKAGLSPSQLLIMGRRVEIYQETMEKREGEDDGNRGAR